MFDAISDKFSKVLDFLRGKKVITEADIDLALRQIRVILLEADVSLPFVKQFVIDIKSKVLANETEVLKSVSPFDMIVKIIQDELTKILGSSFSGLSLSKTSKQVILMVGLQGSGKTTSAAKLARKLKLEGYSVLLASCDIYRAAAREQLRVLSEKVDVSFAPFTSDKSVQTIVEDALSCLQSNPYHVLILDTAGRNYIDKELMSELENVKNLCVPSEVLLTLDALTGQEASNIAKQFNESVGITGIVLTRVDADSRGGAAISVRAAIDKPIKYIGVGEKVEDFEEFHPDRISSRVLDMGDIVSLVERAQENVREEEMEDLSKKLQKGSFNFNDLLEQMDRLSKMGGVSKLVSMIPGASKIKQQMGRSGIGEKDIVKQKSIIYSMTNKERQNPEVLIMSTSRKRRIAAGSGVTIQDVNQTLKRYKEMRHMIEKLQGGGTGKVMKSVKQLLGESGAT